MQSDGDDGERLSRIETFTTQDVCLVRVRTRDGFEGWGQVAPYNADISARVLHRQVAPHSLNAPTGDLAWLEDLVVEREHKFPGSYISRALSGLDTALWDLRGKRLGLSVSELLGGERRPQPVYGSSMRRDITPEEESARLAKLQDRFGYQAFKVRVGRECGRDQDEWPGRTEKLIPAVRQALAHDTALLVDANSGYTVSRAIEVGRLLEDHGVCHFEEPCPYWRPEWTAEVASALDLAVAGGEQDCQFRMWREILDLGAVDIVQPDILYTGGMSRAIRVAQMAHEHGLTVVPHSANLTLVTVFSLHFMAGIKNAGPYVEFSIEPDSYYPWQRGIFEPELTVRDGMVTTPEGPGWGVDIRRDWLKKSERFVSEA